MFPVFIPLILHFIQDRFLFRLSSLKPSRARFVIHAGFPAFLSAEHDLRGGGRGSELTWKHSVAAGLPHKAADFPGVSLSFCELAPGRLVFIKTSRSKVPGLSCIVSTSLGRTLTDQYRLQFPCPPMTTKHRNMMRV